MSRNEVEIVLRAVDQASAALRDVGGQLGGLEDQAARGNRGMAALRVGIGAVATAAAAAATAAAAIGGAGIRAAAEFEAGMANVNTLLGGNSERIDELSRGLMTLPAVTGQSLDTLTDGLYNVVSAFGDTDETLAILDLNARAAAAGLATTSEAIALTSAVTKGYGDTSLIAQQQVADLAFEAVRLGQTTFPELASSMGRVVPIATQLGVSQEELFAVMATATGVTGSAAEVSTQLRGALQALSAPTESMVEVFGQYGVASGDALLESLGLQGAMQAIIDAADASGKPLQSYMGSIEGQTLALVLAGSQADTYGAKLAEMADASGSAALAFDVQQESVTALLNQVTQAGNVILVEIGQKALPVLRDLLQWVVANMPEIQAWFSRTFDQIGAIITTARNTVAWAIDEFGDDFGRASTFLRDLLDRARPVLDDLAGIVRSTFRVLASLWTNVLKPVWDRIAPTVTAVWEGVGAIVSTAVANVRGLLEGLAALLDGDFTGAWDALSGVVTRSFDTIRGIVTGVGAELLELLRGVGQDLMNGLTSGINDRLDEARSAIEGVGTNVANWFRGILGIESPSTVFAEFGRNIVQGLVAGLREAGASAGALQEQVQAIATNAIAWARASLGLSTPDNPWRAMGVAIVDGIVAGIDEAAPGLQAALDRVAAFNRSEAVRRALPGASAPGAGDPYVPGFDPLAPGAPGAMSPIGLPGAYRPTPVPDVRANVAAGLGLVYDSAAGLSVDMDRLARERARDARMAADRARAAAAYRYGTMGQGYTDRMVNDPRTPTVGIPLPGATASAGAGVGLGITPGDTVLDRPEGRALELVLAQELQQRQAMVDQLTTMSAANGPIANLGSSMLNLAMTSVPGVQAAFDGFVQGGPMGAVLAVFTDLLGRSQGFADLLDAVNTLLEPLVALVGQAAAAFVPLVNALQPLVEVIVTSLQPAMDLLGWLIGGLANIVDRIVDAFVGIWNFLLGWWRRIDREAGGGDAESGGLIAELQKQRQAIVDGINNARSEEMIAALNERLAALDDELARLRGLGTEDSGGTPTAAPTSTPASGTTSLGSLPPMVQLAIATPLIEAADKMLDATGTFDSSVMRFADRLDQFEEALGRFASDGIHVSSSVTVAGSGGRYSTAALR